MARNKMNWRHRISLSLFALSSVSCGDLGPSGELDQNISNQVEYRYDGQLSLKSCSLDSIEELKHVEWHKNLGSSVRSRRNPRGNWLRFTLSNPSELLWKRTILVQWINIPVAELCSESRKGETEDSFSGYSTESGLFGLLSPYPHFNIDLLPKETRTFYLRIESNEDLNYPIRLMSGTGYYWFKRFRWTGFIFLFIMMAVFLVWAGINFRKKQRFVYVGLGIHYTLFTLLVYFIHGKEFADVFGNENNLFRHAYFILLCLNHFSFSTYLLLWDRFQSGSLIHSKTFWVTSLSGLVYLLVPVSQFWYEHRILLLSFVFGWMIFYFVKSHFSLIISNHRGKLGYVTAWGIFLFFFFLMTLFHFDFYPYHFFTNFGAIFYLPFFTSFAFIQVDKMETDTLHTVKKSNLTQIDVFQVTSDLKEMLENDKIFLSEDCNEEQVAQSLGIGYHQLSELVNSEFKMNFPSLLNYYRVLESKQLLLQDKGKNISDIGREAGFGSRSAFYLEFKKQTGINPNEYRKQELGQKTKVKRIN